MVDPISGQSAARLLLTSTADASRTARTAKAASPADRILASLDKVDPEQADELRKKLEEAKGILERIKAAKVDFDEQRKAAAREKIQRIKEELKMLRMLAAVDPEAAAKRAAQLSRELSAAVKEYAGASGGAGIGAAAMAGASGGAEAASPSGAAGADGMPVASAAPDTGAGASPTVPGASAAGMTGDAVGAAQEQDGAAAPQPQGGPTDGAQKDGGQGDGASDDDGADGDGISLRERVQEQVAESNRSFGADREDQEFARDVREIKSALKAIIEAAKRKLEQEGESGADQDIKDAEKALNDVDRGLAQISTAGMAGLAGAVNILA